MQTQSKATDLVRLAAALVLALLGPISDAHARTETLRWLSGEAPPDPIEGYRLHHGPSSGVYDTTIDVGLPTPDVDGIYTYDLEVPDAATFHVALTAYEGPVESPYSNERTLAPVVDEPTALDDVYLVDPDGTLVVGSASGVLSNDSDPQGDPMTAVLDVGAVNGTLSLNSDGSFTYTPDPGFSGTDGFTYRADDGDAVSTVATVTITVFSAVANLQAYWRFDEGTGSVASDSSGAGQLGTVVGASWVSDTPMASGFALDFDGVNDSVDVGSVDIAGGELTISLWFKAESFGVADARLISKATGTNESQHYWMLSTIDAGGSKLRARLRTGSTTSTLVAASGNLVPGVWTHAVLVYDGATMRLYKDGVDVGSMPKTGSLATGPSVLAAIGSQPAGAGSQPFDGSIDDVRIYDRALTGAEVAALSTGSEPPPGGAPTGVTDSYALRQDEVLSVNVGSGVLANDSDPDGDPLTAVLVTDVASGSLVLNADGSFQYTPDAGYAGSDSFSYRASDGGLESGVVAVILSVAANQAPTSVIEVPVGAVTIDEGQFVFFSGTGADPDGDEPLTYLWVFGASGPPPSTSEDPGAIAFPTAGTYVVSFRAVDSLGLPDPTPATVVVTVRTASNAAPDGVIDAPADAVTIDLGQSVTFSGSGTDPDGDLFLTYLWDFGGSGASPSTAEDPGAVTFGAAGTFAVSLTVSDSLGLADPTPATVNVQVLAPGASSFEDVTSAAGVEYLQYEVTVPPSENDSEYMTGGAAAGDYDGDGWVDLYVTELDAMDVLYRNRGDGTFEDVTVAAGLDVNLASNGAAWGDVDNDGDLDLYVTTLGALESRFCLFINDGAGSFTEQAVARGAAIDGADPHYGYSVTFADYDLDGWLDIHVTEWRPDELNPGGAASNARLLHNQGGKGGGYFEDVTAAAGVALDGIPSAVPGVTGSFSFASRFADMDRDGWPDLLVSGDYGTSRLFWNNRDGTFTDGTVAAGVGTEENAVGVAVGDYDGDGNLDWFVSSIYDPDGTCAKPGESCVFGDSGNRLYRNNGSGRTFSDQTDAAGVRDSYWGTGSAFFDFDNDGDADLVSTNGANVPYLAPPDDAPFDRFTDDPTVLWLNDGTGAMTEMSDSLGVTDTGPGRGLLTFDYDNDGDLDLFIVNNAGTPVLYRNDVGNLNGWLRVDVEGRDSNRDGIGAVVSVWPEAGAEPLVHEVSAGSNFLGQSDSVAHFGLGAGSEPIYRVEVYWPATNRTNEFSAVTRSTTLSALEPEEPTFVARSSGGGGGGACGLIGLELLVLLPWLARRPRRR